MKTVQVKEVYRIHGKSSMIVSEDVALDYIVALLGHERHLQGIFMMDSNQRFTGMVSRFSLLRWTQQQLYGGKPKAAVNVREINRLVKAKKAKDIITRNSSSFSVKENDTLQEALDLMIAHEETIIPVLDNERRIIGDLCLSEILSKALEVGLERQ